MDIENYIAEYKDCTVGQFLGFLNDNTRVILRNRDSMDSTLPTKAKYVLLHGEFLDRLVQDISVCKDKIGYTSVVIRYI